MSCDNCHCEECIAGEHIKVWRFYDAPRRLQELSTSGGDEDWLALVPASYPHHIAWLEEYNNGFGICDTEHVPLDDGRAIYIGSHS